MLCKIVNHVFFINRNGLINKITGIKKTITAIPALQFYL